MTIPCPVCDDTGWKPIEENGVRRVVRCECWREQVGQHRLGDAAFGLWVLIFSITGYYGIFDFGIRSSIVRYVSKYTATGDHQQINALINTVLFSYAGIGLLCTFLTIIGAFYLDTIFHVPRNFLVTARCLFLMVGLSVAIGFPLGVWGGLLEGLEKFYLLNLISVGSTLLRCGLIVIALNHGSGLLMLAFITVMLPLAASIVRMAAWSLPR